MSTNQNWTVNDIPDQTGRVAIVTGANSGIGYETARALAQKGATVILACRSLPKGETAVSQIRQETPTANLDLMQLDLSDLSSVRQFVQEFKEQYKQLDLLVNNAGVMVPPFTKTKDGFELQFGTNHLGHFALTGQLLDLIIRTPNARVVNVSSMAHKMGQIDFENLNAEKNYNRSGAYGQSKLANLLFTYELQRRFQTASINAVATAAHPGWTGTNLQSHSGLFSMLNPIFSQKPEMGALPTLYAAIAPDVQGGDYYGPRGWQEIRGYPKRVPSNSRSHDTAVAARLWDVSEALTGVTFAALVKK
ncbi:MAG: SDR family NAD(P)-dependent oxidoreductase [Chloroflexi bacterium]|nr:MAG: SDR family NAD(P)-dependent oxidoreductase [Chloroflexota bacterium]